MFYHSGRRAIIVTGSGYTYTFTSVVCRLRHCIWRQLKSKIRSAQVRLSVCPHDCLFDRVCLCLCVWQRACGRDDARDSRRPPPHTHRQRLCTRSMTCTDRSIERERFASCALLCSKPTAQRIDTDHIDTLLHGLPEWALHVTGRWRSFHLVTPTGYIVLLTLNNNPIVRCIIFYLDSPDEMVAEREREKEENKENLTKLNYIINL